MKKSILTVGMVLTKVEQKAVKGGLTPLKKYDPNCDQIVNEGICWGYSLDAQYDHGFDVNQPGGGTQGSGYYEFPCDC